MEKITLLYGTSLWEGITYHSAMSGWFGESRALEQTGMFHIIYFNYYDFMQEKKLKIGVSECIPALEELGLHDEARYISGLKPKKRDNPTLLRCPYMDEEHYRRLERELRNFGYRLMIDSWESHAYSDLRYRRGLSTDAYMIESARAGSSFGLSSYFSAQPTIYFARDEDGPANQLRFEDFYFIGSVNGDESKRVADSFSKFLGVDQVGEVFFEKYVPYASFGNKPMGWRVFFFDGVPFYKSTIHDWQADWRSMPEPPDSVIGAFAAQMGLFGSCDLVLTEGGGWKCSRIMDGQFTGASLGMDDQEYAKAFVKVLEDTPHVSPSWCLTARVKDKNTVGEDHRVVHGTRHFAPGTKVWLHPPNREGRVGAIGVPRYSDKLTRIVMDARKLEGFDVEMVYDKEILAALAHPWRAWPLSKLAPVEVSRGTWDASNECLERILGCIGWLDQLAQEEDATN